jgi:polyphosphate kinase
MGEDEVIEGAKSSHGDTVSLGPTGIFAGMSATHKVSKTGGKQGLSAEEEFFNREISWLAFNERVLQEAEDQDTPLIERMRFLGIFSNNLDEFFRVRMAALQRIALIGKRTTTTLGHGVGETLNAVNERVIELQSRYNEAFEEVEAELANEGIDLMSEDQLDEEQWEFVRTWFDRKVRPHLVPILISDVGVPELKDGTIYHAIALEGEVSKRARFALLELPDHLDRFLVLPEKEGRHGIVFLDDVVRVGLPRLFSTFEPTAVSAFAIKVTRDAEIDMDDDLTKSLLEKMRKGIARRKKGDYVRFLYDRTMPDDLLKFLIRKLDVVDEASIIPGGRYHNRKDLMDFPDLGRPGLVHRKLPPLPHRHLKGRTRYFEEIARQDILLHYPYHSFSQLVDLLREAAIDPKVSAIRINLYRVAKNSHIINALTSAALNGKEVQVVIELQARFDERNNIKVTQALQEAGIQVIFGVAGLKTHSKLLLITRNEGRVQRNYAHVGTGNFNEATAGVFSDLALLTADRRITGEVERLFAFFEHNYQRGVFRHLIVSPYSTRRRFSQMIDREIQEAKVGRKAWMVLKCNNLTDAGMIRKMYEASQAGVNIKLIVRGACALRAGVKGLSENIEAYSIVGRFLEHARVIVFGAAGKPEFYISSADWMTRNLDRRIEVSTPIYDERLQGEISAMLDLQLKDNVKRRKLDKKQKNRYVKRPKGAPAVESHRGLHAYYADQVK